MSHYETQWIADNHSFVTPEPQEPDDHAESEALDAFSRVVVQVAAASRPAVVNLSSGTCRAGGPGSGVLFDPDGVLLANHHVVRGSAWFLLLGNALLANAAIIERINQTRLGDRFFLFRFHNARENRDQGFDHRIPQPLGWTQLVAMRIWVYRLVRRTIASQFLGRPGSTTPGGKKTALFCFNP